MISSRDADESAPFRNLYPESSGERINRVAAIGRQKLMAWYERTKDKTDPNTYGDWGCTFAFSVAYRIKHGDQRTIDKLTGYDYDVQRAIELIGE